MTLSSVEHKKIYDLGVSSLFFDMMIAKLETTQKVHVSEYNHEIPQSQTADQSTAPLGRATGHLQ